MSRLVRSARPSGWRKETTMTSSTTPARMPERQPETRSARPEKKTTRFVIKVGSIIPS